jgi:PPOX class probable F420-dependent enzyme
MPPLLEPARPDDAHIAGRLSAEPIIWLGTVRAGGRPRHVPVWFVWDDPTVHVFSGPGTAKLGNIRRNPAVALSLETADGGNDVVLLEGTAELVDPAAASAAATPGFGDKYGPLLGGQPVEEWAAMFSQPIRITVTRIVAWSKPGGELRSRIVP